MAKLPDVNYLHKDEIISELEFLNVSTDAAAPRDVLRKQYRQIVKAIKKGTFSTQSPREVDAEQEFSTCLLKVDEIEAQLKSSPDDPNIINKIKIRSNYLLERISRIKNPSENICKLKSRIINLLSEVDSDDSSQSEAQFNDSQDESLNEENERKIVFIKEKSINLNSLNIKFDGNSCVRVFIERLEELRISREISETKIFKGFPDLLEKSALFWFRSNRDSFCSYKEVLNKLKLDFDIPDLDYKLMSEIRQRTQSKDETFVNYLSIMQSMFSRLSKPLPETDKLEILMHNIRPEYIRELALQDITSIDTLKTLGKKLELARSKAEQFTEPNFHNYKITADMHIKRNTKKVEQVSTITNFNNNFSNKVCFRCKKDNHPTRLCRSSNEIICFKCGNPGVKATECPKCNTFSKNE